MNNLASGGSDLTQSGATPRRMHPNVRLMCGVLAVCAGYYIGALAGKSLRFPSSNLALIWPPTAILLAGLLLAPPRTWWVYLLAVAPVHSWVQAQDAVPAWGIMSQLLGNFGQAVLAASSVRYFHKGAPAFDSFRSVIIFMLGAVIFAPVVVSSVAAYLYVLSGWEQSYSYAWGARLLSNALTTLLIVPPIILLASRRVMAITTAVTAQRKVEASLLMGAFALTGWISFSKQGEALFGVPCPIILPLPVLLWSAVRFRLEVLCLGFLLFAYLAFTHASGGHGFFAMNSPVQNVLSLQLYLIVMALPMMLLGVLIAERRNKEKAMRESEARYRALVTAGADMVWRANEQGEGFLVNPAWQDLTGQNEERMRDRGWLEAVHPDDRERSSRLWRQSMHDRHAYENELRVRSREGNYRHFHIHAVPVMAPDRSVYEWVGANTDITERRRAEEALKESENQLRLFVEHTPASVAMFDREMRYLLTSRRWLKDYQLGGQDIIGRSHYDVFPEIPERWKAIHRRCLAGAVETCEEDFMDRPDGTTDWIRWDIRPWYLARGGVGGVIMFTEVITERKMAEKAMRESQERYRNVVETQNELICRNLPDSTLTFVNDAYCRYFGRSREQLIGTKFLELIPETARQEVFANIAMLCKYPETKTSEHEHTVLKPDGTIGWQRWTNHVLADAKGQVIEIQGVGRDVTERKRAEEELKKALAEVQRLKEQLEAENVYLRSEVMDTHRHGDIIGRSEGIRKVLEQVDRVAETDMTVLVLGETGTGKELVARLVHEKSGRRQRPLVKVNCSALPADLIESELFGHERGAFTGAVAKQLGRFELADHGTIFLDEIGELPLRLQSKLLRVLQEQEFERLGGAKTIKVDVRVIAATNRNLREAAQRGTFRSDLYYRLNVYPLQIPPLRERGEDIGLLAEVFLEEAGRQLGKNFGKISSAVIDRLRQYKWPGNVRELENIIGRSAVTSIGNVLQLSEGWEVEDHLSKHSYVLSSNGVPKPNGINPEAEATLKTMERARIIEVLNQTNWRIEGAKGAALILGLHPNTLRSRINKLGIQKPVR